MEQETSNNSPTSEPLGHSLTHKKHLTMLDRLSNHHHAARHHLGPEPGPGPESVPSFLALFSSSKLSIDSTLSRLLSSDPKPDPVAAAIRSDLDRVSASISDLERILAQNSFLPSYELRSSLKSISDLKETLEKASSRLFPKMKFSFKNKSKPSSLAKKHDPVEEKSDLFVVSAVRETNKGSLPGLRSKNGAVLVKDFGVSDQGKGEFTLSDLDSCEVYLRGRIGALFINRITNYRVFCGPVLGSILIEEVSGCVFMLASHQIRIHQAKETGFHLRVRSRPIIEDCGGVRFGPYRLFYEEIDEELRGLRLGEETGNWTNVDDFKWLRAVQSPNWRLIPKEEWAETVNASDLEENCGDC